MLIGWANFCLGAVSKAYSAVDLHARRRLRRWLCDKLHEPRPGYKRFPEPSLHSVYGLVRLSHCTASCPWAKARVFDAGKLPVQVPMSGLCRESSSCTKDEGGPVE